MRSCPTGVFVLDEQRTSLCLLRLLPPSDKDILRLTQRLARRVTAFVERRFATLEPVEADALEGAIGDGMRNVPSLAEPAAQADAPDDRPHKVRTSRRSASVDGFSIHADTAVDARNRVGLEKLCRYGLRPAFSHQRLSLCDDGQVQLALRRPWPRAGGVSLLTFEPVAFLRRLAPLIPPPWAHLVRHYGLFAPNAKGRDLLPAAPLCPAGMHLESKLRAELIAPPEQTPAAPPPPPASCLSPTTSSPTTSGPLWGA